MSAHPTSQTGAARDVPLPDWGQAILEEVLFRAGLQASRLGDPGGLVRVELTFDLTADGQVLVITTPGAVEAAIRTRLPLPA